MEGFILVKFSPEQINQVRSLSTTEGFCEAFEQNLKATGTASAPFSAAYELTERAHEDLFGKRKYSCYASFRTTTTRKSH
jgi:hypothetical protein